MSGYFGLLPWITPKVPENHSKSPQGRDRFQQAYKLKENKHTRTDLDANPLRFMFCTETKHLNIKSNVKHQAHTRFESDHVFSPNFN